MLIDLRATLVETPSEISKSETLELKALKEKVPELLNGETATLLFPNYIRKNPMAFFYLPLECFDSDDSYSLKVPISEN